jgi:hypothetical protein
MVRDVGEEEEGGGGGGPRIAKGELKNKNNFQRMVGSVSVC